MIKPIIALLLGSVSAVELTHHHDKTGRKHHMTKDEDECTGLCATYKSKYDHLVE